MKEAKNYSREQPIGWARRGEKYQHYSTHVNNRASVQPASKKLKIQGLFLGVIAACLLMAIASLGQYARMVALNRDIYQLENQIAEEQDSISKLRLEVANLSSVERLEEIARNDLGMERPNQDQLVTIPREESVDSYSQREE